MENTKSAVIKSVLLVVFGALVVLGLFLLFTRNHRSSNEENYTLTVVDQITTTNLEILPIPGKLWICTPTS